MEKARLMEGVTALNAVTFKNAENKDELIIGEKIKYVAVKVDDIAKNFLAACNRVPEDKETLVPQIVVDVYTELNNEIDAAKVAAGTAGAAPAAGAPAAETGAAPAAGAPAPAPAKKKGRKKKEGTGAPKPPKEKAESRLSLTAKIYKANPTITLEELAKQGDAAYVAAGGKTKAKMAKKVAERVWTVAKILIG